jgi:hypothetical protein
MLLFVGNKGSNAIYAKVNWQGASQRVDDINIQTRRPHETGATGVIIHNPNPVIRIEHRT